jgi:hypothetical protein
LDHDYGGADEPFDESLLLTHNLILRYVYLF